MSEDIRNRQRWLIAGIVILTILFLVVIFAIVRSVQDRDSRPRLGHRSPPATLAYCAPGDTGLCVVSFGQVVGGDMLVNLQIPRPRYPNFNLVIDRYGVESTYQCNKVKGLATGVICKGASQVPGEVLLFKVVSKKGGSLLAAGRFAIIGIALSTPEGLATETQASPAGTQATLETETPTMTAMPLPATPTAGTLTVTPTPTTTGTVPSYPNPTTYP